MEPQKFRVIYILPSRYDDDGYVLRYVWGVLPSNTLFCLRSLTLEALAGGALPAGVEYDVQVLDDSVNRIRPERIVRDARRAGAKLLVGMVGVQSNQFPRAGDLALQFREHGAPVMMGGFHVSGVLAMFGTPDRDMERLIERGITMVGGEVESPGVLSGILRDAWNDRLEPVYRVSETPALTNAAVPAPDKGYLKRFLGQMGTMDTSRGCPFNCSFCTIINVQGRKMRHRSAACMVQSIEAHYELGIVYYFFTDDNFSRSPVWRELFDGLKQLRAAGKDIEFMMQVDTQAWKIPGFIEGAREAGCFCVFIGMETINEANLKASSKRQNKVHEYAQMVDSWHRAGILVHAGFIIGFPHDTVDSVKQDLATLRDQIKIDEASFFMLTPLPGSRDHKEMVERGVPIDADLNNLDSFHETFRHGQIAPGDWRELYVGAWDYFYCKENMTNVLLRVPRERYWRMFWYAVWNRYANLHRSHTMITGFLRRKCRTERRGIFPREGVGRYAVRRAKDVSREARILAKIFLEYQEIWLLTRTKDELVQGSLKYLRDRLAEIRQGLYAEGREPNSERTAEVVAYLEELEGRLRTVYAESRRLTGRARRGIEELADETHLFRNGLGDETADWDALCEAVTFCWQILEAFEEAAVRQVARSRRLSAYFGRVAERFDAGRLPSFGQWMRLPVAMVDGAVLGSRFFLAFVSVARNQLKEA